jgi:hypothetical protein
MLAFTSGDFDLILCASINSWDDLIFIHFGPLYRRTPTSDWNVFVSWIYFFIRYVAKFIKVSLLKCS